MGWVNQTKKKYNKFNILIDIVLNYSSLILGGAVGILLNILIANKFGPQGLGVFQLTYAFYIVISQLAVCGIHQSVLRHLPLYANDDILVGKIFWSALLLSAIVSLPFALLSYFLSLETQLFNECKGLKEGFINISFALVFFSCNKVIFLTFNALKKMRKLAFWQSTRFIFMILSVYILSNVYQNVTILSLSFLITECLLFILLFCFHFKYISFSLISINTHWIKKHFLFGVKGMANGVFLELNSKVDILVLGYFSDMKIVGLYSFASSLMEGILGFYMVIKNQFSPTIVHYIYEGKYLYILNLFKRLSFGVFIFTLSITLFSYYFYVNILEDFLYLPEFVESRIYFVVLCLGLCCYAWVASFDNVFLLAGVPVLQSFYAFFSIFSNFILNLILTPYLGGLGTSIATSLSFVSNSVCFTVLAKRYFSLYFPFKVCNQRELEENYERVKDSVLSSSRGRRENNLMNYTNKRIIK